MTWQLYIIQIIKGWVRDIFIGRIVTWKNEWRSGELWSLYLKVRISSSISYYQYLISSWRIYSLKYSYLPKCGWEKRPKHTNSIKWKFRALVYFHFYQKYIQQKTEQNKIMKPMRRKLNNSRMGIIKLKQGDGQVRLTKNKIVTIIEDLYKELYSSREI